MSQTGEVVLKRMWMVGVMGLLLSVVAAAPAGAAAGGNSDNAKLCQKEGWRTLYRGDGTTFASQGECVSYGAHGNTVLTQPPDPWKAACEQMGSKFSVSEQVGGFTLPPPAFAFLCSPVSETTATSVLSQVCGAYPDGPIFGWSIDNGGTAICIRGLILR
jgi:hypothetical protein